MNKIIDIEVAGCVNKHGLCRYWWWCPITTQLDILLRLLYFPLHHQLVNINININMTGDDYDDDEYY